ncbi:hypothetical protein Hanom_Chr12g01085701 [Helianthus anomalus]
MKPKARRQIRVILSHHVNKSYERVLEYMLKVYINEDTRWEVFREKKKGEEK